MTKEIWWVGVEAGKVFIEGPFNPHDVRLYVNGDFSDMNEQKAYAKMIADQLNKAGV